MLGQPTKSCYIFKNVLQALIDAEALKLCPEQKKLTANMTTTTPPPFGWDLPSAATGVILILKGKLRVINIDPHNKKEKGIIPVPTPQRGIMWVHPDLIESQQWMIVTNKKSKGKARVSSTNMVSVFIRETKEGITSLISSGEEESAFAADVGAPSMSKIQSGKQYLKQYSEPIASSSHPVEETIKQPTKQLVDKQKKLR